MKRYIWSVWKNCRLAGYVNAYSEWEAVRRADEKFGKENFIIRVGVIGESGYENEVSLNESTKDFLCSK